METGGGRSDPRPLTREEEAIKRNTDCVYFLASPLTCKKGSDCEYRHSEGARVNPRDCKFWFSGNCMNPKCLFRHPPLDGLVGNPLATSGPVMTSSQLTTSLHLPTPNSSAYNLSRNSVPCYYFQMGTCLKGDKCPFMHFPHLSASKPVAKPIPKASAPVSTQLESNKKDSWKVDQCSNHQNSSNAPTPTVKGAPSTAKVSMTTLENSNAHLVHKKSSIPIETRNGLPLCQTTGGLGSTNTGFSQPRGLQVQFNDREAGEILEEPSGVSYTEVNRPLKHQLRPSQYLTDQWAEEVFRESSPGFDVLVDDDVNDDDYLLEEDGFRSGSVQGARNVDHSSGHGASAAMLDRNRHHGLGDGDRRRSASISERILDKPVLPVRRSAHRFGSPDGMDESDLRHRIIKHRRLNDPSATISGSESELYSSRHELKMEDRYSHNSYRGRRQLLPENNNISSRLRGRIRLPKASSPEFPSELQGGGWGRRHRLSPARPSSLQGRLGERLSRTSVEDLQGTVRNSGSQHRDRRDADPLGFAGPRSLAELKGAKADGKLSNIRSASSPEHNEMKSLNVDSEVSGLFDGPKPVSALRKRNREAVPKNDAIMGINDVEKASGEIEVGIFAPKTAPDPEMQLQHVLETRLEDIKAVVEEDEVYIPSEVEQITCDQGPDDATEERDVEDDEVYYTDQRSDGYDYETIEGRDYKEEDDENVDPMNIDLDDDEDEDDFAKKIGLIFS